MTKYICDRCKSDIDKEAKVYRAIVCNGIGMSVQYDLCEGCYDEFCEWLQSQKARRN